MKKTPEILLLGIGNVLWADEGFGVRVIEHLQKKYRFPPSVKLLDGGTQGMYLLEPVQQADILVIFDAIDFGLAPGTMKCLEDDEVPSFLGAKKMSLHQTGFQEVLASAQMLGQCPEKLLLVGVQPLELEDYGGSLHRQVKARIQPAVDYVLKYLAHLDIYPQVMLQEQPLFDPVLDMARYENERPSASEAFRFGDPRVVKSDVFGLRMPETSKGMLSVDVDYRGQY